MSDEEKSEEFKKIVTFTARVERLTTSFVLRESVNSEGMSSCAYKDETKSDLEAEYDLALDDLIKAKKCIIMLLKKLKNLRKKCFKEENKAVKA